MTKKIIDVDVGVPEIKKYHDRREYIQITQREEIYVDCSVDGLIENLTRIKNQYGDTYTGLGIVSRRDCGCFCDCDCGPSYYIHGSRLETDIEYEFRIKKEQSALRLKEESDRKAYEDLKKKFEGN